MKHIELIDSRTRRREEISEELHWAIRNGEIHLPAEEKGKIRYLRENLGHLGKLICRWYITAIGRGDVRASRTLIRYMPMLEDPYLPDICRDLGICPEDEFMDDLLDE